MCIWLICCQNKYFYWVSVVEERFIMNYMIFFLNPGLRNTNVFTGGGIKV